MNHKMGSWENNLF